MAVKKNNPVIIIIAVIVGVIFLLPMLWMFSTSLKNDAEAVAFNLHWIPKTITLDNFTYIFKNADETPIVRWFVNSMMVSFIGTLLVVAVDSMAAFAFASLEFPLKRTLFTMFLSTMMIPWIVTFLPLYSEFNSFKLLDTYYPLIFPYVSNVFGVFLLTQFFSALPKDMEEAARIDGANKFQIYSKIYLPLGRTAILTLSILTFVNIYNDFLWPLVSTSSPQMRTITVGVAIMTLGSFVSSYGKLMALVLMSTIPMVIIYLIGQKYFIQGIAFSGNKE